MDRVTSESRLNPEDWIDNLSHLARSLKEATSLENDLLPPAISAVEKSASEMLLWAQEGSYDDVKGRVERRVQEVLESICSLSRVVRDDPKMSQMMTRVLNVGDHLLQCHKYILDQQIDRASDRPRQE